MHTRRIGSGGFTVAPVGLGCMPLTSAYGDPESREARAGSGVVRHALDLGREVGARVLLDTADVYGPFTNEHLVGRDLAGRRDDAVVATKCGLVSDGRGLLTRDGRPDHIRRACDASLRRLGVDVIDLYQLHRVDPHVPVEETWGTMAELVAAGKVRALGLSEVGVAELSRAQHVFPVTSVQSELSLWTRGPLGAVLPWCRDHGVGFLAFAPLGRGFLTGVLAGTGFHERDFRARNPRFSPEAMARNQVIVDGVRRVARRHRATPAQVALAWLLAQGPHVVPIPGTSRPEHGKENLAAGELHLTPDDHADLDALPTPAGARY